ncbi:DUF948 domain-containing protein [Georgenia deserti]|uniref:DUF948 domain-containing protein n=1 Tax=Georgenia deserti TaxID=2093781 RepID=A0ABW4L6S7_9MICO
MSVGDVAGLVAALAFVGLVVVVAIPLLKLSAVLDEARGTVRRITDHTLPAIDEAVETIRSTNGQLAKVDTVTASAARVTEDVSALTTLVSAVVGGPLIKVSAFSYAVRRVLSRRQGAGEAYREREAELRTALVPEDTRRPS